MSRCWRSPCLSPPIATPSTFHRHPTIPAHHRQDGFIHATHDAALLVEVLNHFYKDVQAGRNPTKPDQTRPNPTKPDQA